MAANRKNTPDEARNIIEYETEDGRTAYGARDSRGAIAAAERKAKTSAKPAEKESTAAEKA